MTAADGVPILTLSDVTKVYQSRESLFGGSSHSVVALNRFCLAVNPGEIYGLVGESGSGKTTATRLILGLEKPDDGHIVFNGRSIIGLSGRRRREFTQRVQVIFQDPYQSLNAHLSIFDAVCEPLTIHGIGTRAERLASVCTALETAGLKPPERYLDRYPHQLSGGQRQRVAIARAMVLRPRFLIADEPTSMLDASISFQIFQLLCRLRESFGVTMLFITHSLAAARNLCDRVGVIYQGRLVEEGTAQETILNPRHPYTKALLRAHPRFGCHRRSEDDTLLESERPRPQGDHCLFYPRCRLAMDDICNRHSPSLETLDTGHRVSCFLFHRNPPVTGLSTGQTPAPTKKKPMTPPPGKKPKRRGIREILLAGVFWRILIIEMILLVWSLGYKMFTEDAGRTELLWYALRIILLVGLILLFMMVTLRRFLEKRIIRPVEALAEANRRLDVAHPVVEEVMLEEDVAVEFREVDATRSRMLKAILEVSNQRLQLVNFIKDTFGRYLSRRIVDEILESPEGRRIGGRRQTVTVLMSDLRGFSDLSDSRDPEVMVQILNRYLEAMTQVIEHYEGVIDEFIGDAILTVFGIPEEKGDDPLRAVACALAMQQTLAQLNLKMVADGLPPLEMGIGINTGPVVVGNLGSEARTKYGIVGAVVNIASRIESNTVGGQVLVGEATYAHVNAMVTAQPPLTVMMKGLKRPLVCYPVTAIGSPYDIRFSPQPHGSLVELRLPFHLWHLDGKKVVAGPVTGETRELNASTFIVNTPKTLAPLTNVKLLFTFCQEAHCFSAIYAKVVGVEKDGHPPAYRLHVTYMDQQDRALLDRWIRAA
jgi:adenylate cyclase